MLVNILAAVITTITSAIVIVICLLISYYSKENFEWLKQSIEFVADAYDSTVVNFLITVIITLFAEILFAVFAGFIGIILGHKSSNNRIRRSILLGFIAYIIPSMFTLIGMYVIGLFNPEVMNLFNTIQALNANAVKTVLYGGIIMYTVYIALYYLIGKKQFEKGVNVD